LSFGDLGAAADVLSRVGRDATVDMREPVVAAHTVDSLRSIVEAAKPRCSIDIR
jgi:hypothetical protein